MSDDPVKFVIAGPVGAGKTTFVTTLSECEVVTTEALATEAIGKATTTVAFDFGVMHVEGIPVHLFGTPGQDRFDFMWEILCENAVGLILLVAGTQPRQFSSARLILDFVTSRIPIPYVIGVTHSDTARCWRAGDIANYFQVPHDHAMGIDARNIYDDYALIYRLLEVVSAHWDAADREAIPPSQADTK